MAQIGWQEAARAVLERRGLRNNLVEWCRYAGFEPAAHHKLLIKELEAVTRGETDRLLVCMPPGAGKSIYSSILFPCWYLGSNPDHCLIAASHTQELGEKWGRRVRNLIGEHSAILGVGLSPDSQAAGRWETDRDGEYFAAGVGGAIAGRRADLVVIDDPVRSREDADSDLVRGKTWDWYKSDLYTRLKPGGRIVLIQTRWHMGDLAGMLLEDMEQGGDQWRVISLPAICEADNDPLGRKQGEALWPEWENLENLDRKRRAVGPREWSALYQQRPAPEDGDYFKAEWFRPYDKAPARDLLRVYGGSDYAVTSDGGDFTVHCVVGLDPEGRMYLLDVWRAQSSSERWVESFCDLVLKWKPIGWAEEGGQIRSGVGPYLDRRQRERKAYVARETFPTRGDKAVRAQSIRGRMALEGLYVPEKASWWPQMRSELLSFPAGRHDDICVVDGTLISMADGSLRAIELVEVGDLVATPIGPCEVDGSGVTSEAADVCRVDFSDGRSLTGTLGHRVFVYGKGLVRLDELRIMDQCVEEAQELKLSNIGGIDTVDIPTAIALRIGATFLRPLPGGDTFTGMSGKTCTGPFLLAVTSIISTVTGATTPLRTWSVSRRPSTFSVIRSLERVWQNSLSTLRTFGDWLRSGIEVMPGVPGIPRMGVRLGLAGSGSERFVLPVESVLRRHLSGRGFAARGASSVALEAAHRGAGDTRQMVKRLPASAVTGCLRPSGQRLQTTAPRPAGCVIAVEALSEKARVRSLTVRNAHVYYSNGILSRNCDALGLVGQLLDHMLVGVAREVAPKLGKVDDYVVWQPKVEPGDWVGW